MTNEDKMIPLSVVDALLKKLENSFSWVDNPELVEVIEIIRAKIKKEAISIQPSIPMSVVDAQIKKLSPEYDNDPTYRYTIDILRKIKKELTKDKS